MSGLLIRDVGKLSVENITGAETLTVDQRVVLDAYMRQYADTHTDDGAILCPACGAKIHGPVAFGQAFGIYSLEWGIAHGEGFCRGDVWGDEPCGWPVTVYHRVTVPGGEPVRFDMPLPVHPDVLLAGASA